MASSVGQACQATVKFTPWGKIMAKKLNIAGLVILYITLVVIAGMTSIARAAPQPKVYVCHTKANGEEKSIRISQNAEKAHLAHGDLPGKCGEIVLSEWLDLRCDSSPENGGQFLVSNVSFSDAVSTEIAAIVAGDDCAAVQKTVQEAHCRLARDYGTPDAQAYIFNCPEAVAVPD
jgi:hypothetical protein